jgi:hypothetical protein
MPKDSEQRIFLLSTQQANVSQLPIPIPTIVKEWQA